MIVCDGFAPPARLTRFTDWGEVSRLPAAEEPVTLSTTGMLRVTPLGCTVSVTVPEYVPEDNPPAFTVIVNTSNPSAVEPEAGVTLSHEPGGETAIEKERSADPVDVTVTLNGPGAVPPVT
jgi:hypothetical protein